MSHKWQGTFSLVLSKSEGREPSSIQGPRSSQSTTPASFGRFPNGPNDFVNSDGLLIADRPVIAKAQIIYGLPWDVTVSGNVQHQTGRPWGRQIRVSGLAFPNAPTIYMEPLDGSLRVPDLNIPLDLYFVYRRDNNNPALRAFTKTLNATGDGKSEADAFEASETKQNGIGSRDSRLNTLLPFS